MATAAACMPLRRAFASLTDLWAHGHATLAARQLNSTSSLQDMLHQLRRQLEHFGAKQACGMQVEDATVEPAAAQATALDACEPVVHRVRAGGKRKQGAASVPRKRVRPDIQQQAQQEPEHEAASPQPILPVHVVLEQSEPQARMGAGPLADPCIQHHPPCQDKDGVEQHSHSLSAARCPVGTHELEAQQHVQPIALDPAGAQTAASGRHQLQPPLPAGIVTSMATPTTAPGSILHHAMTRITGTLEAEQKPTATAVEVAAQRASNANARGAADIQEAFARCSAKKLKQPVAHKACDKPARLDMQHDEQTTPTGVLAHTQHSAQLQTQSQAQLKQGSSSSKQQRNKPSGGAAGTQVDGLGQQSTQVSPARCKAAAGETAQEWARQHTEANGQPCPQLAMPLGLQLTQHQQSKSAAAACAQGGSPAIQFTQASQSLESLEPACHMGAPASPDASPMVTPGADTGVNASHVVPTQLQCSTPTGPQQQPYVCTQQEMQVHGTARAGSLMRQRSPCSTAHAAARGECAIDARGGASVERPVLATAGTEDSLAVVPAAPQAAAFVQPAAGALTMSIGDTSGAADDYTCQAPSNMANEHVPVNTECAPAPAGTAGGKSTNLVASMRSFLQPRGKPTAPHMVAGLAAASKAKTQMLQRDEGGKTAACKAGGMAPPSSFGGSVRAKVALFQSSKLLGEEHGRATRVPEKAAPSSSMAAAHQATNVDSNRLVVAKAGAIHTAALGPAATAKGMYQQISAAANGGIVACVADSAVTVYPNSQAAAAQAAAPATATAGSSSHAPRERIEPEHSMPAEHADRAAPAPVQVHREAKPKQDLEFKQRRAEQRRKEEEERRLVELQQRSKAKEERSRQALQQHTSTGATSHQDATSAAGQAPGLRSKRIVGLLAAANTAAQSQGANRAASAATQDKAVQLARPVAVGVASTTADAAVNRAGPAVKAAPTTLLDKEASANLTKPNTAAALSVAVVRADPGMPTQHHSGNRTTVAAPEEGSQAVANPDQAEAVLDCPLRSQETLGSGPAAAAAADHLGIASGTAKTPMVAQQAVTRLEGDYVDDQEYQNVQALITSPYVNPGPHHSALSKHPVSYDITPWKHSDDDDDSDATPRGGARKPIPAWAKPEQLVAALTAQAQRDPDEVFGMRPNTCNLPDIFHGMPPVDASKRPTGSKRLDYTRRGSSGNWVADRVTWQEELRYKRAMGFPLQQ